MGEHNEANGGATPKTPAGGGRGGRSINKKDTSHMKGFLKKLDALVGEITKAKVKHQTKLFLSTGLVSGERWTKTSTKVVIAFS